MRTSFLALLFLAMTIIGVAHAQAPVPPTPPAQPTPATKPTTTAIETPPLQPTEVKPITGVETLPHTTIERDIEKAKDQKDQDARFRALRRIRVELSRVIDDTKLNVSLERDAIKVKEEQRKATDEERRITIDGSAGPPLEDDLRRFTRTRDQLERQLKDLPAGHADTAKIKEELARTSNVVEMVTAEITRRTARQGLQKQALEQKIALLDADISSRSRYLVSLERSLRTLLVMQSSLDDEINDALKVESQRNDFKTNIALAFTGLVLLVILGFFGLSFQDQSVRRAIFSSESGIQFITLFSVVIAIILFGITGILESKELAALLGGLSGYILGRVSSNMKSEAPPSLPPPAARPAPPAPVPAPAPVVP